MVSSDAIQKLIENSQWEALLDTLQSGDETLDEAASSPSASFFLHKACERRAPHDVIAALIKFCPESPSLLAEEQFPLHIATHRNLEADTIETLIRAFPEALDECNKANCTPRNIGHRDIDAFQSLRRYVLRVRMKTILGKMLTC